MFETTTTTTTKALVRNYTNSLDKIEVRPIAVKK